MNIHEFFAAYLVNIKTNINFNDAPVIILD